MHDIQAGKSLSQELLNKGSYFVGDESTMAGGYTCAMNVFRLELDA